MGLRHRRGARRALLAGLAGCAALPALQAPAAANEPPDWPGIACTVQRQDVSAAALRLVVRFDNRGSAPAELPPGTQLAFHRDAAASDALEVLARMDRLQRSVLVIAPGASAETLFVVPREQWAADLCRGPVPAAAAINLYRFSPRPQHRCVLKGLDIATMMAAAACGAATPAPSPAPSGSTR